MLDYKSLTKGKDMPAQTPAQRQARYMRRIKQRASGSGFHLDAEVVNELRSLLTNLLTQSLASISPTTTMEELKRTAIYRRALNELSRCA